MSIGERIKRIRGARSREDFATQIGVNASSVQRWEKENVLPSGKNLKDMLEILKVNIHWLLSGEGEPYSHGGGPGHGAERAAEPFMSTEAYYLVGKAEGTASGGPGKVVFDNIVDYFPFKREFIHRIGGTSEEKRRNLYLLQVKGNSMLPTITEGELILVNCNEDQRGSIVNNAVYVIRNPYGDIEIKRLYTVTEDNRPKLLLVPDNRSLSQYTINLPPGQRLSNAIIGRVVWVGKELI